MGLDISVISDVDNEIFDEFHFYKDGIDYYYQHSLSRMFCKFINRRYMIDEEAELDQIGRITLVDISPIYEMEGYPNDNELEFYLENEDDEETKSKMLNQVEKDRSKLEGNIDRVLFTIKRLIIGLNEVGNLTDLLNNNKFDTLCSAEYFADFNLDKGNGYIGNNFGHDLRNFERFLDYSKQKGAKTVWFRYS